MYKIIRFTPASQRYYPKSLNCSRYMKEDDIDHTSVDFALGASRIGGPIVDLPESLDYPENMFFAAQLDLKKFSAFDPLDFLPKTGFLYFFIGNSGEHGKVLYANVEANQLTRIIREHDGWFFYGCLVNDIFNEKEDFRSRYRYCEAGEDLDGYDEGDMLWDYHAGSEKSKIYGIYTHCQKHEETIKAITQEADVLLLQIGEDFTGEGVWSVQIDLVSLIHRRFHNCRFEWGQT